MRTKAKFYDAPYGVCPKSEVAIPLPTGNHFVFPNAEVSPEGTDYVRIVRHDGGEIAYWDSQEWADEPVEVMGAICGSMLADEEPRPEKYYQMSPEVRFPEGVEYARYGE